MAPRKRNDLFDRQQYYMDYGVDIEGRRIDIHDVDENDTPRLVRALRLMEEISTNPIDVFVSSFGGGVYTGLALYGLLRRSNCVIRTHCEGMAMSMGLILFMAGDERYCDDYSTFMAHQVSSVNFGDLANLKNEVAETERLNCILVDILAEKSNKDKKWWDKEIMHTDKFYNKKKAKELGIVNEEY